MRVTEQEIKSNLKREAEKRRREVNIKYIIRYLKNA